jgi:flagellar basal body-associated protein FliL
VVVVEVAVGVRVRVRVVVVVVVAPVVEEEEEAVEEAVEEPEEVQTLSLSLIDILVFLLPKARTICWSPKISFPANLYTARNEYPLKVV